MARENKTTLLFVIFLIKIDFWNCCFVYKFTIRTLPVDI